MSEGRECSVKKPGHVKESCQRSSPRHRWGRTQCCSSWLLSHWHDNSNNNLANLPLQRSDCSLAEAWCQGEGRSLPLFGPNCISEAPVHSPAYNPGWGGRTPSSWVTKKVLHGIAYGLLLEDKETGGQTCPTCEAGQESDVCLLWRLLVVDLLLHPRGSQHARGDCKRSFDWPRLAKGSDRR